MIATPLTLMPPSGRPFAALANPLEAIQGIVSLPCFLPKR